MIFYFTCCLCTGQHYRSRLESRPSVCCMVEIPSYPLNQLSALQCSDRWCSWTITKRYDEMMSEMREVAQKNVKRAQKQQKVYRDQNPSKAGFRIGDQVFVYMPTLKSGPAHKLAIPFTSVWWTPTLMPSRLFLWTSPEPHPFMWL